MDIPGLMDAFAALAAKAPCTVVETVPTLGLALSAAEAAADASFAHYEDHLVGACDCACESDRACGHLA